MERSECANVTEDDDTRVRSFRRGTCHGATGILMSRTPPFEEYWKTKLCTLLSAACCVHPRAIGHCHPSRCTARRCSTNLDAALSTTSQKEKKNSRTTTYTARQLVPVVCGTGLGVLVPYASMPLKPMGGWMDLKSSQKYFTKIFIFLITSNLVSRA